MPTNLPSTICHTLIQPKLERYTIRFLHSIVWFKHNQLRSFMRRAMSAVSIALWWGENRLTGQVGTRKLKCSGDAPTCARCSREMITCVYSPQKQMGRPRKRRREDDAELVVETGTEMLAANYASHDVNFDDISVLPNFASYGLESPPELQDLASHGNSHLFSFPETRDETIPSPGPEYRSLRGITYICLPTLRFGLHTPVDPTLWYTQSSESHQLSDQGSPPDQHLMGPCTCLSLSYLTLTELQSVSTFAFPQVIIPLRKAMDTVTSLIQCPVCPKEVFGAIQNLQSIVSLFKAIIERFSKVLDEVDAEAGRLEQSGLKKPYRIGDNSPGLQHLHTGTLDCPMGFSIEIESGDWKKLVKTALRTEIYGGGSNTRPLNLLLKETEVRQAKWHSDKGFLCDQRMRMLGANHDAVHKTVCAALGSDHLRMSIQNMNWT
jgi:hypothetical protein